MPNTRKKYHGKKHKTQRKSKATAAAAATMEQIKQNRLRNKMVRNIRMGRVHQGGGGSGQMAGGGFMSQFIGKPWSPGSIGNYFSLSPKGVGTGHVPKFDDGRPLYNARFATQLGAQVPKLGQRGGSSGGFSGGSRSRKNIRGGGILDGATYLLNKVDATLSGTSRPLNPDPHSQPFLNKSCNM
jgi:hypothetical protein